MQDFLLTILKRLVHLGADFFAHSLIKAQKGRFLALLQLLNLLHHIAAPLITALQIQKRLVERRGLHITDLVVRVQVFQARRRQSSDARLQVLSAFEPLNLLTQGALLLLEALDGEVFAPGKHLSLPQFCLLFLKDLFPHFSLRVCILLEKFMVFLKAGQARVGFFGFMLRIISLLLEFISLLVHLD